LTRLLSPLVQLERSWMSMAPLTVLVTAGRSRRGLFSSKRGPPTATPSITAIPGALRSDGILAAS
jgi:hypothetical protein